MKISAADGIDAVVLRMRAHEDVAAVQEEGCEALRNLAEASAENQTKIATAGGIDAVVFAMRIHQDVAGVQEWGSGALAILANNAENKEKILAASGIDLLLRSSPSIVFGDHNDPFDI